MSAYGFNLLTGGSISALDAITGYGDGDVAFGVIDGLTLVYQMDTASGATADGDLVVQPDDAADNERWIKMVPGGAMSHVFAIESSALSLTNDTDVTMIFGTETTDTLDEFNTSTGEFTVKYAGVYLINAMVTTAWATWSTSAFIVMKINKNGTQLVSGPRFNLGAASQRAAACISCSVTLAAGDTITIIARQNQGGSVDTNGGGWVTIDRIV